MVVVVAGFVCGSVVAMGLRLRWCGWGCVCGGGQLGCGRGVGWGVWEVCVCDGGGVVYDRAGRVRGGG